MKTYFFIASILMSQLAFSQAFKAGIFAGLVSSQVDGDKSEGYHKMGFQAGAFSKYVFNEQLFLNTELKYIQKGSKHSDAKDNLYFTIQLNYVEVPVLIQYQVNEHFVFGGGLSYAYLLKANVDDPFGAVPQDYLVYKEYDMNVLAQMKYLLGEHFWVDFKFAYSILYITKESPRQFNNLLSVSFGYEI